MYGNLFGAPDKLFRHYVAVMSADLNIFRILHRSNRSIFDAVFMTKGDLLGKLNRRDFARDLASFIIYQADKSYFHQDYCRTYTFYCRTIYVTIKILRRKKSPADRNFCRTKPNFDFSNRTNVRCPSLFQGLFCLLV